MQFSRPTSTAYIQFPSIKSLYAAYMPPGIGPIFAKYMQLPGIRFTTVVYMQLASIRYIPIGYTHPSSTEVTYVI